MLLYLLSLLYLFKKVITYCSILKELLPGCCCEWIYYNNHIVKFLDKNLAWFLPLQVSTSKVLYLTSVHTFKIELWGNHYFHFSRKYWAYRVYLVNFNKKWENLNLTAERSIDCVINNASKLNGVKECKVINGTKIVIAYLLPPQVRLKEPLLGVLL